jgi:hypothetical protein
MKSAAKFVAHRAPPSRGPGRFNDDTKAERRQHQNKAGVTPRGPADPGKRPSNPPQP